MSTLDFNKLARGAGALFIFTMAVAIAGNMIIVNLLDPDDYLTNIAANQDQLGYAGVFMIANCLGVIGIAALFYPILTSVNKTIGITYLSARIFEAAILTVGIIAILTLGELAPETEEPSGLYTIAKIAIRTNWYAYNAAMASLGLGSIPFCLILLRKSLVPRALSILGLIAYSILFLNSMLAFIGMELGLAVTFPGFIFEVSLGFWLLFKGLKK